MNTPKHEIDRIFKKWEKADYQSSALTRKELKILESEIEEQRAKEAAQWARQAAGN